MRTGPLALLVLGGAFAAVPALACHACPEGDPCPPHASCGGDVQRLPGRVVLLFIADPDRDAMHWVLHGRVSQRYATPVPRVGLHGRIRCIGQGCAGRRGRFAGQGGPDAAFVVRAGFSNGARCEFSGLLAQGSTSNPYRCTDARGQPAGEGTFDVRIASPPRRGG